MFGLAMTIALMIGAQSGGEPMDHARGTFDVKVTPVEVAPDAVAGAPGRMLIAKVYHGDIEGTGTGEMLATLGPDQSGAYVAMERVIGTVGGRMGGFTIAHLGLMNKGAQDLSITVVPGSGTGELTGITGLYVLTIKDGQHFYDLEYALPTP